MNEAAFFFFVIAVIGMLSVIGVRKLIRKRQEARIKELNEIIKAAKARRSRD